MQVEILLQNKGNNTISSNIETAFSKNPKKIYCIFGELKESGFKIIEDGLIDTKIKAIFIIGIDKKNTTKGMLEGMLNYTKDVYYYSNNNTIEFDSSILIFEYTNEAIIYILPSGIAENELVDNLSFYTKLLYDFNDEKDKIEYKNKIKEITKNIEQFGFIKLDKSKINELIQNKEIFSTRQYTYAVKSISELLGSQSQNESNKEKEKSEVIMPQVELPKIDISDIDIDIPDIDLSLEDEVQLEEVKEENKSVKNESYIEEDKIEIPSNDEYIKDVEIPEKDIDNPNTINKDNELYDNELKDMEFDKDSTLDIEDMLFSKADVKLDLDNDEKKVKNDNKEQDNLYEQDENIMQVKKVNLNNVSNFIFELPQKSLKSQDTDKIKIPNYIQKIIPNFFELQDKGKSVDIDGITYKKRDIKVEVVDVKENKKYTDREAKIIQKTGQTYLSFSSDVLKNIDYDENDIARIIKLAMDIYHIEIISSKMQEYNLWHKLCNQKFKSSTRKYGMM